MVIDLKKKMNDNNDRDLKITKNKKGHRVRALLLNKIIQKYKEE
jgi:hypothetical protein